MRRSAPMMRVDRVLGPFYRPGAGTVKARRRHPREWQGGVGGAPYPSRGALPASGLSWPTPENP